VLLAPDSVLPACPRRVLVAGASGAGKTTVARRTAEVLGVPHVEIDALFHGPDWTRRPAFLADVAAFSATPGWVTEWQYAAAAADPSRPPGMAGPAAAGGAAPGGPAHCPAAAAP